MNNTSIAAGATGTADFALEDGIKLQLHLDQARVAADGIQVVNGTITTTYDGTPTGVGVQLQGMPGVSPTKAVTSGPLAAVCSGTTRVWPPSTTTLQDPYGTFATVTTDSTGHYNFTIAVGTTPGVWSLEAWAKNTAGQLSADASAHETQSITFHQLSGPTPANPKDFATDFDQVAPHTPALTQISQSSNTIVNTLAQTNSTDSINTQLGTFAFALVNARDGQSILIFPANSPPRINPNGVITSRPANADDVVIDPAEWTGSGSLQSVLDSGTLPIQLPTVAEFGTGKIIAGWKTVRGNEITLFSTSFEFLGWGYFGVGAPGACY